MKCVKTNTALRNELFLRIWIDPVLSRHNFHRTLFPNEEVSMNAYTIEKTRFFAIGAVLLRDIVLKIEFEINHFEKHRHGICGCTTKDHTVDDNINIENRIPSEHDGITNGEIRIDEKDKAEIPEHIKTKSLTMIRQTIKLWYKKGRLGEYRNKNGIEKGRKQPNRVCKRRQI